MAYKLVIFDFDGTLADTFPWFKRVIRDVADKHGFNKLEESELEALREHGAQEVIRRLGVPMWKVPRVGADLKAMLARDIAQIALFEGVDRMLGSISAQGVQIAVVSSNNAANVRRILGPANADRIRYYDCGASIFGKASRFRNVLRKSGVGCRETLCVGDEIRDLEAAHSVEIDFGAVSWGFTRIESMRKHSPAHVFLRVDEIAELFSSRARA